jgi:hypothetical protein
MTFRQRVALDRDVANLAQVTPVRVVIGRDEPVGVNQAFSSQQSERRVELLVDLGEFNGLL